MPCFRACRPWPALSSRWPYGCPCGYRIFSSFTRSRRQAHRPSWRRSSGKHRQKDLVVISWPIIVPTITFYLPDNIAVTCFPDNARTKINRWDGMIDRVRDDRNLWALLKRMEQTLSSGGKIWLIDRAHPVVDRDYAKSEGLGKLIYLDAELYRMDQIRTWLDHHAQQLGKNRLAPGRDFSVFLAVYQPRAPKEVRESPARMR